MKGPEDQSKGRELYHWKCWSGFKKTSGTDSFSYEDDRTEFAAEDWDFYRKM